MTSLAAASSVALLRRVAFLGGTPLGNSLGSIPSVLALTNSVITREYHEKVQIVSMLIIILFLKNYIGYTQYDQ